MQYSEQRDKFGSRTIVTRRRIGTDREAQERMRERNRQWQRDLLADRKERDARQERADQWEQRKLETRRREERDMAQWRKEERQEKERKAKAHAEQKKREQRQHVARGYTFEEVEDLKRSHDANLASLRESRPKCSCENTDEGPAESAVAFFAIVAFVVTVIYLVV